MQERDIETEDRGGEGTRKRRKKGRGKVGERGTGRQESESDREKG